MAASFTVRTTGQTRVEAELGQLIDAFDGDGRLELMGGIGLVLESNTIQRFDDERAPDGAGWLPSFRARTQGGKTLSDSGRLKQSITHIASATQVEVGTNVKYARPHQLGAIIRPVSAKALTFSIPGLGFRSVAEVTLPARPFLGVSADDETDVLDLAEAHATNAASGLAS